MPKKFGCKKTSIPRIYTLQRDAAILLRLNRGEIPKGVSYTMGVSVWRVYDAVRRRKQREGRI